VAAAAAAAGAASPGRPAGVGAEPESAAAQSAGRLAKYITRGRDEKGRAVASGACSSGFYGLAEGSPGAAVRTPRSHGPTWGRSLRNSLGGDDADDADDAREAPGGYASCASCWESLFGLGVVSAAGE
jgi:hypothetical protein